eukprot:2986666-Prymnesium_polylepis.1
MKQRRGARPSAAARRGACRSGELMVPAGPHGGVRHSSKRCARSGRSRVQRASASATSAAVTGRALSETGRCASEFSQSVGTRARSLGSVGWSASSSFMAVVRRWCGRWPMLSPEAVSGHAAHTLAKA